MSLPELYERMANIKKRHGHWDGQKKVMEKIKEDKNNEEEK